MHQQRGMTSLETLLDVLDHGCDGEPRSVAMPAATAAEAASLARAVSAEAERRGYLVVASDRFEAIARALPPAQRHRTFVLLDTCDGPDARHHGALIAACSVNARPHVLVTILVRPDGIGSALTVREARAAYVPAPRSVELPPPAQDSLKHLSRAARAMQMASAGRHEAAVRLLRESLAAVMRRRDCGASWHVAIALGRLLLERGKPQAAEKAFAEAVSAAEAGPRLHAARARVWLALARTDAGRLTEAEAMLRAIRMSNVFDGDLDRAWLDAALARCVLWQRRIDEAEHLMDRAPDAGDGVEAFLRVQVLATQTRVLLEAGRTFEAGRRARAALDDAARQQDLMQELVAGTAHLRVLAAGGDLVLAGEQAQRLTALARRVHAPLRSLRVRAIWAQMLRRAGRSREADREVRRLGRAAAAAPPLLRRHLEEVARAGERTVATTAVAGSGPFAIELLRATQHEEDDRAAVRAVMDRLLLQVRAARIELQTAAGAAFSTLVTSGTGAECHLGLRTWEAGILIGPERQNGCWELAAPVRAGHRMIGVLACRWPLGREVNPAAAEWAELAAAVLAPRVDLLLASRDDAARATTEIPELIGVSAAIADVRQAIARAAGAPFAVLIEGESGVGKELAARAIHQLSARRDRPFCDLNCAALPDELVEAELFGHARGAFTGALVERRGVFEEAHGGTLFLDELPDLSLRAQAKLLRTIQQGEIRRVGESFSRKVDVRLVTATNRPLEREVAEGRFRQDLLYRLDVIRLRLPPLRDRPEDILLLARRFWTAAAERAGTRAVLSHAILAELARYHWPGNVRELQNVMAALAVAAPARGVVRPALLPAAITGSLTVRSARLDEARRQFERRFIEVALARAGGSRTRAAQQLGLSRQGLVKLMARLGLAVDRPADASP